MGGRWALQMLSRGTGGFSTAALIGDRKELSADTMGGEGGGIGGVSRPCAIVCAPSIECFTQLYSARTDLLTGAAHSMQEEYGTEVALLIITAGDTAANA